MVISHLKDSDDREEKKKLIGLLQFPWVDFLREVFLNLILPSTVAA